MFGREVRMLSGEVGMFGCEVAMFRPQAFDLLLLNTMFCSQTPMAAKKLTLRLGTC